MTVPTLSSERFMALLKNNGWDVVSNEFFYEHNRIMLKKGEVTFPLQYKEKYAFTSVVRLCRSLEIPDDQIPEDHLRCYEQYEVYKQMKQKEEQQEQEKKKPQ